MSKDLLRYDRLVENALKGVVRQALEHVSEYGLPGAHHIYLTFLTEHPNVEMPDSLREKYPSEMTIVLQYQFWDLDVGRDGFAVSLSFNDVRERLCIPFAAVTAFADPSVNFALQFQMLEDTNTPVEIGTPLLSGSNADVREEDRDADDTAAGEDSDKKSSNVVALDAFRKD
jgi:hypothetical protein